MVLGNNWSYESGEFQAVMGMECVHLDVRGDMAHDRKDHGAWAHGIEHPDRRVESLEDPLP
jgi:hypothetical protein